MRVIFILELLMLQDNNLSLVIWGCSVTCLKLRTVSVVNPPGCFWPLPNGKHALLDGGKRLYSPLILWRLGEEMQAFLLLYHWAWRIFLLLHSVC